MGQLRKVAIDCTPMEEELIDTPTTDGAGEEFDVTQLLREWATGDQRAEAQVLPLIYAELRNIARSGLNGDAGAITLQATDLVNEAYLRLSQQRRVQWQDRDHFFAVTATVVRRILLDAARKRLAGKRDKRLEAFSLDGVDEDILPAPGMSDARAIELLDLDQALVELAAAYPRPARLVELRYFSGLSLEETAKYLDISLATAKRDWTMARAWLLRRLQGVGEQRDPG